MIAVIKGVVCVIEVMEVEERRGVDGGSTELEGQERRGREDILV